MLSDKENRIEKYKFLIEQHQTEQSQRILNRITYLESLPDDYDGEGSKAIPSQCIEITLRILLHLLEAGAEIPEIYAGIDLEWENKPGLSCTIHPDKQVDLSMNRGQKTSNAVFDVSTD